MSALRVKAQTERTTQLFTNLVTIATTDRFDANGTALSGGSANTPAHGTSTTVGGVLVRDMGKVLRVPINSLSSTVAGTRYRVLRKVQLLDRESMSLASTVGANSNTDGVSDLAGSASGLLQGGCFYIQVGGTAADGSAYTSRWASVTIAN
jgi:hypothetical protein